MARKSAVLIPMIIAAAAVGGLGVAFAPAEVKDRNIDFPKGTVRINDEVITVEIAESTADKQRWLTFRQDKLPLDTALMFKHHTPDLYEIWMLNVEYNLDLVWFDEGGNAVYLVRDAPPCENVLDTYSCTYKPTARALYVMAATSGFIDAHGIEMGSKMTVISA